MINLLMILYITDPCIERYAPEYKKCIAEAKIESDDKKFVIAIKKCGDKYRENLYKCQR